MSSVTYGLAEGYRQVGRQTSAHSPRVAVALRHAEKLLVWSFGLGFSVIVWAGVGMAIHAASATSPSTPRSEQRGAVVLSSRQTLGSAAPVIAVRQISETFGAGAISSLFKLAPRLAESCGSLFCGDAEQVVGAFPDSKILISSLTRWDGGCIMCEDSVPLSEFNQMPIARGHRATARKIL